MKKVVIVGVGALGSHVVMLARNWDAHLAVVDFDRVETKNCAAQFHGEMGKGKNKAKAIEGTMQGMWHRKVESFPVLLTSHNIQPAFHKAALAVDCTDNFTARQLIQTYCQQHAIECLHGCMSASGDMARAVWTEHFTPDHGGTGEATCVDGANLAFHAMASALIAQTAQTFLTKGIKRSWHLTPSSIVRIA